jgi:hypothetical protein
VITRWNPFNPFWIVPLRAWTYLRLLERAGQRKQLQVQAISNTKSKDPELFLFYDGAVTSLRVMENAPTQRIRQAEMHYTRGGVIFGRYRST